TWNRAFEACDDDVVVQWGADFLLEDVNTLRIAVRLAEAGRPYVYAFDRVTKLSLGETTLLLRGRRAPRRDDKPPFGGVRAVRREVWEAGRYDERFVGWGHEDRAFVHAMRINGYDRTRVPGRMILLRHPGRAHAKRGDASYANEAANLALTRRYEAARTRAALEVLHSEATVAPSVGQRAGPASPATGPSLCSGLLDRVGRGLQAVGPLLRLMARAVAGLLAVAPALVAAGAHGTIQLVAGMVTGAL